MSLNSQKILDNSAKNHILPGVETMEGNGVQVNRLFPVRAARMNHDPFVLWDHFELASGVGFPEHPHRGFEGITYLFEGGIQHADNLGNGSTLLAGGAQRFTAGKGIHHSEMPVGETAATGIQMWVNLPRRLKQLEPEYQQVDAQQIPEHVVEGVRVRSIVEGDSSVTLNTQVQYLDLFFEQDADYEAVVPATHNGLVYIVDGEATVQGQKVASGEAYLFYALPAGLEDQTITISARQGARVMLAAGEPHNEPIYQHGPFVD